MSFNISDLKKELEDGIGKAVTIADLAEKFASVAKTYGGIIPGAGPQIQKIAELVDDADQALHKLQAALGAV